MDIRFNTFFQLHERFSVPHFPQSGGISHPAKRSKFNTSGRYRIILHFRRKSHGTEDRADDRRIRTRESGAQFIQSAFGSMAGQPIQHPEHIRDIHEVCLPLHRRAIIADLPAHSCIPVTHNVAAKAVHERVHLLAAIHLPERTNKMERRLPVLFPDPLRKLTDKRIQRIVGFELPKRQHQRNSLLRRSTPQPLQIIQSERSIMRGISADEMVQGFNIPAPV